MLSTSAAAETRYPRKNMITAMRTVFFRIFVCYVSPVCSVFRLLRPMQLLTGLIVGMLIPSNDPQLFKSVLLLFEVRLILLTPRRKTGNAGQSPFVLVFNRAGVKGRYLLLRATQSQNVSPFQCSLTL
jgi:yeast amino acid transporter